MRTLQSGMQPDDVSWEVNFVCHIAVHVNMSIVQTVESTVESVESVEMCSNPIQALMLAQGKGRRWEMAAMNPVRILGVLGDQRPSIR